MEDGGCCDSPGGPKEEKGSSEESCAECCSCEACRPDYSAEDTTDHLLQSAFTKIRQGPRHVVSHSDHQGCVPPEFVPVSPKPAPDTYSLAMALEELQARQAQLRTKRQRRCAFCRIHGFPVSLKGHKALCQFRERCMCTGCTLIRCNQRVSKNQVKLRRLKNFEADLDEGLTPGASGLPSSEPSKKSPMCFKCWIHDSVRVRLKGHRTLCPYARCACSNCALNADRKWLTRQLRQLSGAPPLKEEGCGRVAGTPLDISSTLLPIPSTLQGALSTSVQHLNTHMTLKSATKVSSECGDDGGLGALQLQSLHKANDWHLSPGLASPPAVKQGGGLGGCLPSSQDQTGGAQGQQTVCQTSGNTWLLQDSTFLQPPLPPPFTALPGHTADMLTISSSDYDSMGVGGSSGVTGRGGGGVCRWYPQPVPCCVTTTVGGPKPVLMLTTHRRVSKMDNGWVNIKASRLAT
ncbi:hypothetical protein ACOMHN_010718 [Nucella lapillus]